VTRQVSRIDPDHMVVFRRWEMESTKGAQPSFLSCRTGVRIGSGGAAAIAAERCRHPFRPIGNTPPEDGRFRQTRPRGSPPDMTLGD